MFDYPVYLLYRAGTDLLVLLPLPFLFAMGQICGAIAWLFLPQYRKLALRNVRIAFGGMAATPKRATKTEHALRGQTLAEALKIKLDDYQPISDMRASAQYRMETAQGLLNKALMELRGATNTRVLAC